MRKFLEIIQFNSSEPVAESATVETPVEVVEETVTETSERTLQKYLDEVVALNESLHGAEIGGINVDEFIQGYVGALLWSSTDESDESGGVPLDRNYDESDFSPDAHDQIVSDCRSFLHRAAPYIREERFKGSKLGTLAQRAGHDFWLTRAGHGSGFWDGDWEGEEYPNGPLTKIAKSFGEINPYVGDDQKIHLM